ncbi:MAG: hypothetical protein C5B59_00705 [Bacteroidetes bacterium]|nr:MAG: hypothetical protein C5B59_00705 [Bacteroidota bacterium]
MNDTILTTDRIISSKIYFMDIKTKLDNINKEIQSMGADDYIGTNSNLLVKLEQIKNEMVDAYENYKGLNKYMVRLPMWLIDMNLMDFKRRLNENDKEVKSVLINNIKQITNKAIELFEKAFTENKMSVALN